ncbi:ATP-binding protein, partial [Catellatospora methionotrophica]|uniref:ATP-binding protein n=1 Tax=Catellatospora methionotrophica TaxID=121620 RepID=UPI003494C5F3
KTRLALAAMRRAAADRRDGAAFVDLSAITDARLVPDTIAQALDLVVQGRENALDALRRRLSDRDMLIVLDNFEQVLDAAPVVADLLQHAPLLHILVTSRVVLRIRGEQEWPVQALALPPAYGEPDALAQAPALRLFVDRVRDVQPGFALTEQNTPVLAELCRRLGGLPLALELAAAWMRLLTPEQMLTQLFGRLEQQGTLVDLPDRQQTMSRTISWSYDLLPASAQALLTRLSVFADPFTVDGVVAVCSTDGADVIEDLSALMDSSMVSPVDRTDGERGFQLLEPIRRFAAARLTDPDHTLGRLHGYVLDVLKAADTRTGSQDLLMRRLDSEQLNLQVVLAWVGRTGQPSGPLVRSLGNAWLWMLACGLLRQSAELWKQLQALPPGGLRTDGDRLAMQWLTANRLLNDGDFDQAGTLIDQMMPHARRLESPGRLALLLTTRAITLPRGAHQHAGQLFEQAQELARGANDPLVRGYLLSHHGLLSCVDGQPARARDQHRETLDIADSLNDANLLAEANYELAWDDLVLTDPVSAHPHLVAAERGYRRLDHLDGLTRCLGALSELAVQHGEHHLAVRLAGSAAAAREQIGLTPWPSVAELEQRTTDGLRATLPDDVYRAQFDTGRRLTVHDALAEAHALPEHP